MPIETVRDLREHVELAIRVELSTIPPYLYAMYSIENQASDAALLIRSIVAEEMLHAALATNLLLAVGGEPDFDSFAYMPSYPQLLPHHIPPLELELAPASKELIERVFMRIEQPELHGAPAEPDEFETLGQFYHALEEGIDRVGSTHDLFADPQPERQLADASFYAPVKFDAADSGGLSLITDAASADAAIEVIVHQGEGLSDDRWADPSHQELTHYYKLAQIADGTSPLGRVYPLPTNPRTVDYPVSLQPVSDWFNATYRYLFAVLERLFSADPDKLIPVKELYRIMSDVLSGLAHYLGQQPLAGGERAAPTFELVDLVGEGREQRLQAIADRAVEHHPELSGLAELMVAPIT